VGREAVKDPDARDLAEDANLGAMFGERAEEGPDLEARTFTLADLRWAQRQGIKQGVENALTLIEAGGSVAYVREHLLEGS